MHLAEMCLATVLAVQRHRLQWGTRARELQYWSSTDQSQFQGLSSQGHIFLEANTRLVPKVNIPRLSTEGKLHAPGRSGSWVNRQHGCLVRPS
eukprot:1141444-Pelagomonas_calceolata.AAC.2